MLTRYLAPSDYGVAALVTVLAALLAGLFSLGTGASIGVRYFEAAEGAPRARVIWTSAALLLVNSAVLAAAGFLLAPQLSRLLLGSADAAYLVRLSLAALAVSTVTTPFLVFLQLEERAKTFVALTTVSSVVTILIGVAAVVQLGRGISGLFEAGLIGAVVLLAVTLAAVSPRLGFGLDFGQIGPLVRIGFPGIFGLGAFFFIDWSDRVLLERLAGLDEVGVYSIGYSFGMVMSLAVTAFGSAWPPYFIAFINRRDEAVALFGRVLKYYVFLFGTLTLVFFLAARPVVLLMTAPAYHGAFTVVGFVALSYTLKGAYLIMLPALVYEKKLYLQTGIEWAAAAVNLALNFLLIPLLRKDGAAVATLVAYACLPALTCFVSARYLPVRHDWKAIGKFAAGFAAVVALSLAPFGGGPLSGLAIAIMSLILFGFYVLYVPLSSGERGALFALISSAKDKFRRPSGGSPANG